MISLSFIESLLPFIAVGFFAQIVDGALGMAFGVITNTLLVTMLGMSPSRASANVHVVEVFTTAVSGISHFFHKNIDYKLFARLAIPGVIGGVAGATVLSNINGDVIKPWVLGYLLCIGIYLLSKALFHIPQDGRAKIVEPLGLFGGFMDAIGGGGWGPVVTSNLLVQGVEPRKVIGTVNSSEFFLTASVSATFIYHLGLEAFSHSIIGLLIGGVIAAPFGAYFVKNIPAGRLMTLVGTLIVLTSGFGLYKILG